MSETKDTKKKLQNRSGLLAPSDNGTAAQLSLHTKLPIFVRLDILPFALAYAVCLYLYLFCWPEGGSRYSPTFLSPPSNATLSTLTSTDNSTLSAAASLDVDSLAFDYSFLGFCLLPIAGVLHLATLFIAYWSITARCFLQYRALPAFLPALKTKKYIYVKAVPHPHCGAAKMCQVKCTGRRPFITFQECKYVWHSDPKHKLGGQFVATSYPVSLPLGHYRTTKGLTGGHISEAWERYGDNEFNIPLPPFEELFQEHALAPFFVFQVFCVGLWCLDEYWYYSIITLIMLFIFEKQVVNRRLENLQKLRDMRMPPYYINVYRREQWVQTSTSGLLPGDIIELIPSKGQNTCPCDCLLLFGSCVVNEAMLTGESVPLMKEAPDCTDPQTLLDTEKTHKRHVVFGGTQIVTASLSKSPSHIRSTKEKGCIAYVLRTGFGTSQGRLVRTILFSTERVSVNNAESLLFIAFLLVFAVIASAYVLVKGLEDESRSRYKLMLNCIMIITSVVPPELPMELSLAVNTSLFALFKQDIYCTEPFRIPLAGAVDICCFDKTGTLTSDRFNVMGVSDPTAPEPTILDPTRLSAEQNYVLAGCHSLVYVSNQGLIGDPMELASFHAIRWQMTKNQTARGRDGSLRIEQRFGFSSVLQRMSSIVILERLDEFWATAKGSPEIMASRFKDLPDNYHATHRHFSSQGCRVLALGYRRLGRVSLIRRDVRKMTRDDIEKDLRFCGFLVLHCPLKHHSYETIKHLNNSSHRTVMITGDHTLTACHVSHALGISKHAYPSRSLILTEEKEGKTGFVWASVDTETKIPFDPASDPSSLTADYDLCVSGAAVEKIIEKLGAGPISSLIPHVSVFARFSPSQKELVLTTLKKMGLTTLMCGDGTNDVGALKQAHVGVALISREDLEVPIKKVNVVESKMVDSTGLAPPTRRFPSKVAPRSSLPRSRVRRGAAPPPRARRDEGGGGGAGNQFQFEDEEVGVVKLGDASIASPFTSKKPYVSAVVHILRQGRCTLVTTYQMFRILALNCLVSAYSMSVLYLDGVKYGDWQMTVASLAITFFFFFISRSTPLEKLSAERPASSLFSLSFFLEIIGQFAMHMVTLTTSVSWALPHTPRDKNTLDPDGDFKANVLNSVVFLVSTSMTVATFLANYRGHPFMISITQNKLLLYSLLITESILLLCALDFIPPLQYIMELAPLPNMQFRFQLFTIMILDLVGTVVYTMVIRRILRYQPKEASHQKKDKDV